MYYNPFALYTQKFSNARHLSGLRGARSYYNFTQLSISHFEHLTLRFLNAKSLSGLREARSYYNFAPFPYHFALFDVWYGSLPPEMT